MNRMEEFNLLMQELEENTPDLSPALRKAKRKKIVNRFTVRPLVCILAAFSVFVLLINVSAPVANACANIPILADLAQALSFRPALSEAVDNNYVQEVVMSQSKGDVTVTIEYIIADEMQTNVVFRVDPDMKLLMEAEGAVHGYTYTHIFICHWMHFAELGDGYYLMSLENMGKGMVKKLDIDLHLYDSASVSGEYFWEEEESRELIADFSFAVEPEKKFYGKSKFGFINQPLLIDDQKFTVSNVTVYPTISVINLKEDPENTAWIHNIAYYLEADDGTRFEEPKFGITSSALPGTKSMLTYRAESPYFLDVKELKLVITGVNLEQKEDVRIRVDLATGETEDLPQGVTLMSAEKNGEEWLITLRIDRQTGPGKRVGMNYVCYDPEGKEYYAQCNGEEGEPNAEGEITYNIYTLRVGRPNSPYPYDEIWLSFSQSQTYFFEEPIVYPIPIELGDAEGS